MKQLKHLALAASLLMGSQAANAITPWANGAPYVTVYISGAVAQTNAYTQAVTTVLAQTGTVDTFNDVDPTNANAVGSRWTAHYFVGSANLGSALQGKNILLVRRTVGGSGDGVIPLVAGLSLEHLNIANLPASAWTAATSNGAVVPQSWTASITQSNATTYLSLVGSDAGIIAVDPYILLKPGTANYPAPANALITGLPVPNWPTNITTLPTAFVVNPLGGLTYGIAVTLDLYKVLQAAQKRAGTLPSTVAIGSYSEASMPSLSHEFIGSLMAGKIGAWDQVQIVDTTNNNKVISLNDTAILNDAGVAQPYKESTTGKNLTPVAVALRNDGAATFVIANSVFLGYPANANAASPALPTANDPADEDAALPIVKEPIIVSATGTLLSDWQNGTNALGFNNVQVGTSGGKPVYANRWGIALNSADRNNKVSAAGTGGDPWRYVKIDGYAPTLINVAAGDYDYWAEGTLLYKGGLNAKKLTVASALAQAMGSPTVIAPANTTQPWGQTGAFATAADPRKFTPSVPFNPSNPVVPYSHYINGKLHTEIAPVINPSGLDTPSVQMK